MYFALRELAGGIQEMEIQRKRCKQEASPAEGEGTVLLFEGRVVSDSDASSSSLSFFLSRTLSSPPPCLLPTISSPQREKRWSISSAGGEKNSSSVSRGVSGR